MQILNPIVALADEVIHRTVVQPMRDYMALIDRNTDRRRCDVTPVFGDVEAFGALVDDLMGLVAGAEFTTIVAIDALGFVLGAAMAVRGHKRLVLARKGGKLPVRTHAAEFVDYTGQTKSLEIRRDAIESGTRVLVVDEWVETGAQVLAAGSLVEMLGGVVVGVASIHIDEAAAARLTSRGCRCFSASRAKT